MKTLSFALTLSVLGVLAGSQAAFAGDSISEALSLGGIATSRSTSLGLNAHSRSRAFASFGGDALSESLASGMYGLPSYSSSNARAIGGIATSRAISRNDGLLLPPVVVRPVAPRIVTPAVICPPVDWYCP